MKGTRGLPWGIAGAFIATLAAAFFLTDIGDPVLSSRMVREIYDLGQTDAALVAEVISLQETGAQNFDELVRLTGEMESRITQIRADLPDDIRHEVQPKLDALAAESLERQDEIETFKATTALMKNSLARMHEVLDLVMAAGRSAGTEPRLRESAEDFAVTFLEFLADPREVDGEILLNRLDGFRARAAASPTMRGKDLSVLEHLPVLVRTRIAQSEGTRSITKTGIADAITALDESYISHLALHQSRSNAVRIALFFLSGLLSLYVAYVLSRERILNKTLDTRVRLRTAELEQSNSKLLSEVEERKLAQNARSEAEAQLIQSSKLAALGEMAGGVAHEINTPLGVISLRSHQLRRLLQMPSPDLARAGEFCANIQETSARITQIVAGLKTFSRSGANDPMAPTDVASLVNETLSFCADRLRLREIAVSVDVPQGLQILCRSVQISQVLLNLLNNAHDALANRGGAAWIKIEARRTGVGIEMSVTDSGDGIPEGIREKIFQPFFTTKAVNAGTGLGLSVSHGIIQAHGGALRVDGSCPHTRFVMLLLEAGSTEKAA